jgi:hypothetical protein
MTARQEAANHEFLLAAGDHKMKDWWIPDEEWVWTNIWRKGYNKSCNMNNLNWVLGKQLGYLLLFVEINEHMSSCSPDAFYLLSDMLLLSLLVVQLLPSLSLASLPSTFLLLASLLVLKDFFVTIWSYLYCPLFHAPAVVVISKLVADYVTPETSESRECYDSTSIVLRRSLQDSSMCVISSSLFQFPVPLTSKLFDQTNGVLYRLLGMKWIDLQLKLW